MKPLLVALLLGAVSGRAGAQSFASESVSKPSHLLAPSGDTVGAGHVDLEWTDLFYAHADLGLSDRFELSLGGLAVPLGVVNYYGGSAAVNVRLLPRDGRLRATLGAGAAYVHMTALELDRSSTIVDGTIEDGTTIFTLTAAAGLDLGELDLHGSVTLFGQEQLLVTAGAALPLGQVVTLCGELVAVVDEDGASTMPGVALDLHLSQARVELGGYLPDNGHGKRMLLPMISVGAQL